jgi:predicted O-methyltransferase YrrM
MTPAGLAHSPAAERNRGPIGEVLLRWLAPNARVLEIGSGTGQHAAWFHALLPGATWQTTDLPEHLDGIRARLKTEAPALPEPLALDVTAQEQWPEGPWDVVYTANTLHIMPWSHTPVLLERSAERVRPGGLLVIYGPFRDGERFDADSNRRFDEQLRQRGPAMGIRDILKLRQEAGSFGWTAEAEIAMPANNRILIFRRNE